MHIHFFASGKDFWRDKKGDLVTTRFSWVLWIDQVTDFRN